MTTTTVTSENLAEFNAAKLGLSSAPAPAESAPEATQADEPIHSDEEQATAEETAKQEQETEDEPKKGNPKIDKRFGELTKQREEARREAAREREAREVAERRAADLEAQQSPQKADASGKPDPAKYTDAFKYAEDLARWSTQDALSARDKQEQERKDSEKRQKVVDTWKAKEEDFKAATPDFEETVRSSTAQVSDQVTKAILESDVGPQILYHLAKNPEIVDSINSLPTDAALRQLMRLEVKLSDTKPAAKPAPVEKPSGAPSPITPIRATKSVDVPLNSKGEFTGSYATWKEARKSGRIR